MVVVVVDVVVIGGCNGAEIKVFADVADRLVAGIIGQATALTLSPMTTLFDDDALNCGVEDLWFVY